MTASTLSTRDTILQAANRVVLADGAAHLTLDAVAREAGVSKGGLLYHFPNKDALVTGMINALIERFNSELEHLANHESGVGAWVRTYTRATFHPDPQDEQIGAALLAAVGTNPDLLAPLVAHTEIWQKQAEHAGIDPVLATVIRLAADGLYMNELLGLSRLAPEFREQVMNRLIELSRSENP
jgi:AcrR family transcriptional regulator